MTVDEAWQEYAHKTIPMTKDGFVNHTTTFIYPLAGVMYKTFVAGWEAADKNCVADSCGCLVTTVKEKK